MKTFLKSKVQRPKLVERSGGTGFQPVQFGLSPNCGMRGQLQNREQHSLCVVAPVSGGTSETTGWKPVPPGAFENYRHA